MKRLLLFIVLCTGIAMFLASPVCAKVTGMCGDCHTMHNSQDNLNMMLNTTIDGTSGGPEGGGYPSLTRGSCVGCHTGANTSTSTRPFVYNTDAVNYDSDTLAGGNFKWVETDDAKGHNVLGIPNMTADTVLLVAPGDLVSGGCTTGCHATLFAPTRDFGSGGAALNTGCEGCHLAPKHHAPQQAAGAPATVDNGYFRFLSAHMSASGVHGIEDDDWQYTNAADDHNEYLGNTASVVNTMTGYCVGCHGAFHTQLDGNDNWIRHPSDAVLPDTGEYTGYVNYDPMVPVARTSLTGIAATNLVANNADMVMCLSCHRAHGSPYDDLLRWNYDGMIAGGGTGSATGEGCFVCHTLKDE